MLFNTLQFVVFLFAVLTAFYLGPVRWRKVLLLIASYYFYMCWNPKFILLLLTLTTIDYYAALWIQASSGARRKTALVISLAANLGFLGFFKYYNFLASNTALLMGRPANAFFMRIILPLGISFHTFQSMSYVIDIYRGQQQAVASSLDYALYLSFFPQLVAGPIVRAKVFFADLYNWVAPSALEIQQGMFSILFGMIKKVVFADQFALIADAYFGNLHAHPGMFQAWTGTAAFAMQIFFDFSGYTDIAIGSALLLGFHFPANFRRPYLAASITEFWRRWHISLSTWLRDYLYIPLGGNRHGKLRTYGNLMITMLLGGLWHGANWNFMIWGGYHGVLLSLERMLGIGNPRSPSSISDSDRGLGGWASARAGLQPRNATGILRLPWICMTFALVCVGWVFFRAANLGDSIFVIQQMFAGPRGKFLLSATMLWMIAGSAILAVLEERYAALRRIASAPMWAQVALASCGLLAIELFGVTDVSIPFVYFQF
jgi:alginate O-acetyltransferase complex protein AlgI